MKRSRGFRVNLRRSQATKLKQLLADQRATYNWAVSRLKADPALTKFDLQKEFTILRQSTPHLQHAERSFQNTAIRQARTAADLSNRRGSGNLKYRTRKRPGRAVECDVAPTFVGNQEASLPGLGRVRLAEEQPYAWPDNWLHGARSFRLVDVSPRRAGGRVYRLYVTYNLPDPEPRAEGLAAGIGRGIASPTIVARSDGSIACYDTAARLRANQHWNDRIRRRMSGMSSKSRNYRELARRRSKRNEKDANERDYCEWLLAKEVCGGVKVACLADLGLEAAAGKWTGGRGLNHGMRFVRHSSILRKIRIVAERLGIRVVRVNPQGTSRECSACRRTGKRDGERFECPACGLVTNADANASCNIINRGTDHRVPAGEGTALERRELGRTRKPPAWVQAAPDAAAPRRENQARNRPAASSAGKHLGRYAYVKCAAARPGT